MSVPTIMSRSLKEMTSMVLRLELTVAGVFLHQSQARDQCWLSDLPLITRTRDLASERFTPSLLQVWTFNFYRPRRWSERRLCFHRCVSLQLRGGGRWETPKVYHLPPPGPDHNTSLLLPLRITSQTPPPLGPGYIHPPPDQVIQHLPPSPRDQVTTPPSLSLGPGHNTSSPPGTRSQHLPPRPGHRHPPPPGTLRRRVVRILLECILVKHCICAHIDVACMRTDTKPNLCIAFLPSYYEVAGRSMHVVQRDGAWVGGYELSHSSKSLPGGGYNSQNVHPWKVRPQCWHLVVATQADGAHPMECFLFYHCFYYFWKCKRRCWREVWMSPQECTLDTSRILSSALVLFPSLFGATNLWKVVNVLVFSACGGDLTSEHGAFNSPQYPASYPNNRECIWTIKASPGNSIIVTFR